MLLILALASTLAQVAASGNLKSLSAQVDRGWLKVIGLDPNGPVPAIEVDAVLDPFDTAVRRGGEFRFKLPAYRGRALLPARVNGTIFRGEDLVGNVSFVYPRKRYEVEPLVIVGFTHKEADHVGGLIAFPLHAAGLQTPPARDADEKGNRLGRSALVLGHMSVALGVASADDVKGVGFAYGLTIYVPFMPAKFILQDLRGFIGQRVKGGQRGRLLWGIAYSKRLSGIVSPGS